MQVVVGRIGRAHGIRGELNVDVRTDEPERRFAPGSTVIAANQLLKVAATRWHSSRLLVRFEGIDDRDAAEAIRGVLLEVEVDDSRMPEEPDEFYDHQLIGLQVRAGDRLIGTVTQVVHLSEQDTLAIAIDDREVLVPFVLDLVPEVHIAEGYLTVSDVPGLLNPAEALNAAPDADNPS